MKQIKFISKKEGTKGIEFQKDILEVGDILNNRYVYDYNANKNLKNAVIDRENKMATCEIKGKTIKVQISDLVKAGHCWTIIGRSEKTITIESTENLEVREVEIVSLPVASRRFGEVGKYWN